MPGVLLFVFSGKWLYLLFGESYSVNASCLLQILAISSLPLVINHLYFTIFWVTNRIRKLTIIWGLVTIVVVGTSYLIILLSGIIGSNYVYSD